METANRARGRTLFTVASRARRRVRMAPVAKKRKREVIRYPCHACALERASSAFPDYNPTQTCQHLINICSTCLKDWIEAQLETTVFAGGIACPQCDEVMQESDVEMAARKKAFQRFTELNRRYTEEQNPGWRWCLDRDCKAGQVHRSPEPAEGATSSQPDICTCDTCGAEACVRCDRPWHEGETCEAYQTRVRDHVAEAKTIKTIANITKKCPSCQVDIQKNGGCPDMTCLICKTKFCWGCMQVYKLGVLCLCRD